MEEKIWDLSSFRKNLMLISVFNILVSIFYNNIKDINFLFFKMENIDDWKVLVILLSTNLYCIWRYNQYLTINLKTINYKFLFKDVVNNEKKYTSDKIRSNWQVRNVIINENDNLIVKTNNDYWLISPNFMNDDKILVSLIDIKNDKDYSHKLILYKDKKLLFDIRLNYKNNPFIFKDKYYADRYIPIILWYIWVILIFILLIIYLF